jgi:NADPH2:quinone reductase
MRVRIDPRECKGRCYNIDVVKNAADICSVVNHRLQKVARDLCSLIRWPHLIKDLPRVTLLYNALKIADRDLRVLAPAFGILVGLGNYLWGDHGASVEQTKTICPSCLRLIGMKAIQVTQFGGPEVMEYVDIADPSPKANEELITVTAIGINYADTHQIENGYLSPQTLPLIPGLEVVGNTNSGQRVLAAVEHGGYAQKAIANKSLIIDVPDGITDAQALCMLVQGTTAWHILKTVGHLSPYETVVIHAAAGGVGTIAIQLAKLWGAKVIAVTSSPSKAELAKSLGADVSVDANSENLSEALLAANGGKRVDLVLEMVGGKTFDASLEVLAPFGRLVTYGNASRKPPRAVHPGSLITGTKTITGFWLAHCFGHKELLQDVIAELFRLILVGKITPVIGGAYPLSLAVAAHQEMLARKTSGKLTLDPAK